MLVWSPPPPPAPPPCCSPPPGVFCVDGAVFACWVPSPAPGVSAPGVSPGVPPGVSPCPSPSNVSFGNGRVSMRVVVLEGLFRCHWT